MAKNFNLLICTAIFLLFGINSRGQLIGGNAFLQGHWLEIGELNNGAFGVCAGLAPASYHPGCAACAYGNGLAAVYDYGHDGWTVGTPAYYGDYMFPGTPFEGWELQVAGVRTQAMQGGIGSGYSATCPGNYYGGPMTGSITSYSGAGSSARSYWNGTCSGLTITQETRVDYDASWVVVTTRFYNRTAAPINDIYYLRTTDPDNDQTHSGSFRTTNTNTFKDDIDHRVLVSSVGTSYSNAYLGLGTKDCRARGFWYSTWPIPNTEDLAPIWAGGAGSIGANSLLGAFTTNDWGMGLVYNIGTIAASDSAIISYAYIFDGIGGLEGAFPEPLLVVNGYPVGPSGPAPAPTFDSFWVCSVPGMTTLPVDIYNASDKVWSWSNWSWSRSTGLTGSGTSWTIDINALTGPTTYTITGTDSAIDMKSCAHRVMVLTVIPCHTAHNNSPCIGDTLKLADSGSNIGATYYWRGPGGFTSTLQNPYKYPSVFADSGWYFVYKTVGSVIDSDSTHVVIHPLPVLTLTTNTPLCMGMIDTLRLGVTPDSPGERFYWTGPNGYIDTNQLATRTPFSVNDTGYYQVIGTTQFGCKDSAQIDATLIPQPPPPIISDPNYCQGQPFVPFTVVATGTVKWWPAATGGVSSSTAPTVPTSVPGLYRVWASQKVGNCESQRGTDSVRVTTTPAAPLVSGPMQYCQFVGPLSALVVTTTLTGTPIWYSAPTGGTASYTELWPNLNVAGTYTFYISQVDSGCEGPRTSVDEIIHPKPVPPTVSPYAICQFKTNGPLTCTLSDATDYATWFANGIPAAGTTVYPTPQTTIVTLDTFYVNETSIYGCISDKTMDIIRIKAQPMAPITSDTAYCQGFKASPLNIGVDSSVNSSLNYYLNGVALLPTPVPSTSQPGTTTYYVSQTVEGCEGDSAAITVTVILQPSFTIKASQPWVCLDDSITFQYQGPVLDNAGYQWYFPNGDYLADGASLTTPTTYIKFNNLTDSTYVVLRASDDFGKCWAYDTVRIRVIPHPIAIAYTKEDICQGDTTSLALATKSDNSFSYQWYVNSSAPAFSSVPLFKSTALTLISSGSNTGGPFNIAWNDTGRFVIQLNNFSEEGCTSNPTFDTVNVHALPDATFRIELIPNTLCIEDSVLFLANAYNYRNSYEWTPEHAFTNVNKPEAWGRVEQSMSEITLKVTNPYGCKAQESLFLTPGSCCTVAFPNAFTPNGDGHNDVFHPLYEGYHRFHEFRIQNRWGQTVFNSSNSNPTWDGNFNGVPQDMGVYFYYIKYDCGGKTIVETGDVTLVR